MINVGRLSFIEEKVGYLSKQISVAANWIAKAEMTLPKDSSIEDVREKSIAALNQQQKQIDAVYEEVSGFTSKQILDSTPADVLLKKISQIDKTLKELDAHMKALSKAHYNAKLDPFAREIGKAVVDLYEEFDLLIPHIKAEIELLGNHFRNPANAERTIMPELNESVALLNKRQISVGQFLAGYEWRGSKVKGYNDFRAAGSLFSRFQYYENLLSSYEPVNGTLYNLCKVLEPFMQEKRNDGEFASLVEKFDAVNHSLKSRKPTDKISSMSKMFDAMVMFNSLLKKVGAKHSFTDSYQKSMVEFNKFLELHSSLITYNRSMVDKMLSSIRASLKDEANGKKLEAIIKKVEDGMVAKRITFAKLEAVFVSLAKGDYNVVVDEKDAADISINTTPQIEEQYGAPLLRQINITIEELDFWYPRNEKSIRFEKLAPFTSSIQRGETLDLKVVKSVLLQMSEELEKQFRSKYDAKIISLMQVTGAMVKLMSSRKERENLDARLIEKNGSAKYVTSLSNVKRCMLAAKNLMDSGSGDSPVPNVNKFPFIKMASLELGLLLYELSMRIFILYANLDRRSTNQMVDILSILRQHNDVIALFHAFNTFLKTPNINNFDVMESKIIFSCKSREARLELKIKYDK